MAKKKKEPTTFEAAMAEKAELEKRLEKAIQEKVNVGNIAGKAQLLSKMQERGILRGEVEVRRFEFVYDSLRNDGEIRKFSDTEDGVEMDAHPLNLFVKLWERLIDDKRMKIENTNEIWEGEETDAAVWEIIKTRRSACQELVDTPSNGVSSLYEAGLEIWGREN